MWNIIFVIKCHANEVHGREIAGWFWGSDRLNQMYTFWNYNVYSYQSKITLKKKLWNIILSFNVMLMRSMERKSQANFEEMILIKSNAYFWKYHVNSYQRKITSIFLKKIWNIIFVAKCHANEVHGREIADRF